MICICGPKEEMTGFPINFNEKCAVHQPKNAPTIVRNSDDLQLVVMIARDIVELWPTITIRTLFKMTDKVNMLREALKGIAHK